MRTVILLIFFPLLVPSLRATNYYVDSQAGNDSAAGTSLTTAWKTLARVSNAQFQPGDSILLRRGAIWREQLTLHSSGAQGSPIILDAYGDGQPPIISGADAISSSAWTSCTDCGPNVWKSSVAGEPHVVIFDGQKGIHQNNATSLQANLNWTWSSGSLYIYSGQNPLASYSKTGIEAGARMSGIDLTGLAFIVVRNIEIEGANAIAYAAGSGIWAIAKGLKGPVPHDITISQVTVENCAGDGIHLENAPRSSVTSSLIAHNDNAGIVFYGSIGAFAFDAGEISNNEVHHNHFTGINIIGCPRGTSCRSQTYPDGVFVTNLKISGNRVHDNGAGIYLHQANKSYVGNNVVYANTDPSRKGEGYCVGLSGSSDNIVEKNECYQARFAAIEASIDIGKPASGSSNNLIRYNVIHDDGTHGLFTNYGPSANNQFSYNLVYNHPNGSCFQANFIGHKFFNNTCYNNRYGIHFYVSKSTPQTGNISVKNNLIINSREQHVLIDDGATLPDDFQNNQYFPDDPSKFKFEHKQGSFPSWQAATGQDSKSFVADPAFAAANPASPADFSLTAKSPAVGKGTDLGPDFAECLSSQAAWPNAVKLTKQSNSWDIGAFQHTH